MKCYLVETGWGWIGLTYTTLGLHTLILPQNSHEAVLQQFPQKFAAPFPDGDSRFFCLVDWLQRYFRGEKITFTSSVDWSPYTDFQRRVLTMVQTIPFGETRSYQWVALWIGQPRAVRAVGQAVGANRTPVVIPCHRVIKKNGKLGGFSSGLGYKQKLLKLENPLKEV